MIAERATGIDTVCCMRCTNSVHSVRVPFCRRPVREVECAHPFREGNGEARPNLDGGSMRALLTVVAGGTVGVDRYVDALDDFDRL